MRLAAPKHSLPFKEFACSGVYFLHNGGAVVYVGQATNMMRRIGTHLFDGVKVFDGMSAIPCSVETMGRWERFFIGILLPKYNQCSHSIEIRHMIERGQDHGAICAMVGRPPRSDIPRVAEMLGVSQQDMRWRPGDKHSLEMAISG